MPESSKLEQNKKLGKKHWELTLRIIFDEIIFWDFWFFFVTVFLLFVKVGFGQMSKTNLHKLLHHKRVCDGHITYTCVLWLRHKIHLWFRNAPSTSRPRAPPVAVKNTKTKTSSIGFGETQNNHFSFFVLLSYSIIIFSI